MRDEGCRWDDGGYHPRSYTVKLGSVVRKVRAFCDLYGICMGYGMRGSSDG